MPDGLGRILRLPPVALLVAAVVGVTMCVLQAEASHRSCGFRWRRTALYVVLTSSLVCLVAVAIWFVLVLSPAGSQDDRMTMLGGAVGAISLGLSAAAVFDGGVLEFGFVGGSAAVLGLTSVLFVGYSLGGAWVVGPYLGVAAVSALVAVGLRRLLAGPGG